MAEFHARRSGDGPHGNAQTAPRWDDHFAPERAGAKPAHPLSRATYALGSLLSVALVIGLGVTGYKLLVRDVSGVPVIRAVEGPTRVQPEDPGGEQTLNQGLAVNAVAAVGSAGAPPDELILAPAPLNLSDEDVPHVAASPSEDEIAVAENDLSEGIITETGISDDGLPEMREHIERAESDDLTEAFETAAAEDLPAADLEAEFDTDTAESPEMLALAKAIGAAITPLEALPDSSASEAGDAAPRPTVRPIARPAALSNIRQTAVQESSSASNTKDIAPESIAAGTRLAQLGAFSSEEIAREEWERLSARFGDYLANKDRVIQRATSGGRTFYRLRALGFEDLADARRFCSALVAEKAECIPVIMR